MIASFQHRAAALPPAPVLWMSASKPRFLTMLSALRCIRLLEEAAPRALRRAARADAVEHILAGPISGGAGGHTLQTREKPGSGISAPGFVDV